MISTLGSHNQIAFALFPIAKKNCWSEDFDVTFVIYSVLNILGGQTKWQV